MQILQNSVKQYFYILYKQYKKGPTRPPNNFHINNIKKILPELQKVLRADENLVSNLVQLCMKHLNNEMNLIQQSYLVIVVLLIYNNVHLSA